MTPLRDGPLLPVRSRLRTQDLANRHLREFAEAGDPFSQAILAGREIP